MPEDHPDHGVQEFIEGGDQRSTGVFSESVVKPRMSENSTVRLRFSLCNAAKRMSCMMASTICGET